MFLKHASRQKLKALSKVAFATFYKTKDGKEIYQEGPTSGWETYLRKGEVVKKKIQTANGKVEIDGYVVKPLTLRKVYKTMRDLAKQKIERKLKLGLPQEPSGKITLAGNNALEG